MTLDKAIEMGKEGKIEEWIHKFLLQPDPHGNIGLSEGLKLQKRYWIGPIKTDLNRLVSKCGPDPKFEFYEPEEYWNHTINRFVLKLKNGEIPPPLICEFRNGSLVIADGSHRFAALKETGYDSYWCLIWFNTEEEYKYYLKMKDK